MRDITGRQGLFLVREIDGSSNTLFSWDSSFWVDDAVYEFSIGREREEVSVSVAGLMRSTPGSQSASKAPVSDASATYRELGTSVEDSVFLDGRIGVYTESQASRFSQLSVTVDGPEPDPEASSPNAVPAPATFLLLVSGMSLLRRRLGIARR